MTHSKRGRVIAGNWKMFKTQAETRAFFAAFNPLVAGVTDCDIVIAPPSINIPAAVEATKGTHITISAQNIYWEKEGAFTGEISAGMVAEAGCRYVIIGHSERRHILNESSDLVSKKTHTIYSGGLIVIHCVGETLEQRDFKQTLNVIRSQLSELQRKIITDPSRLVIAYEPVWAIGTGRNATDQQAQEVHAFIRQTLGQMWNPDFASRVRIQYGGSLKPENAKGLLSQPDVDGGLIGGASLKADSFLAIVNAAASLT